MTSLADIPPDVLEDVLRDPIVEQILAVREGFWYGFKPRPDKPELFDEQHSFCMNRDPVSFLIGGNAAGTTEAAAWKTAQFVLRHQKPPRKDTPFWIISETYEQVCDTCWKEKLLGRGHIPPSEVDWERIRWLDAALGLPMAVPLKPWPGEDPDKNWMLEFKSYKQGRKTMQARSIGGFWFSEQFPWPLFIETLRGCRNYMFPGGQFAEFTPIEPELCLQIEKIMEEPPKGWRFYRANTAQNKPNLADGWYDNFFATVSDEMRATRETGALASFQGVIYPAFSIPIHVVKDADWPTKAPPGCYHHRGIDWGASEAHPLTCLWGYYDGMGDWWVYDEYWSTDQTKITQDHIEEIRDRYPWPDDAYHGMTFADPSRPGEINTANVFGVPTQGASNDIYKGIETVRTLLKINPATGKPKLRIHERCKHLIEEFRKYRWVQPKASTEGTILNPTAPRPVPLKRDDDTIDNLRYIVHSVAVGRGATMSSMRHADYSQRHGTGINERSNSKIKSLMRGRNADSR